MVSPTPSSRRALRWAKLCVGEEGFGPVRRSITTILERAATTKASLGCRGESIETKSESPKSRFGLAFERASTGNPQSEIQLHVDQGFSSR